VSQPPASSLPPNPWKVPPSSPWGMPPVPRPLLAGRFWRRPRRCLPPRAAAGMVGVALLAGLVLPDQIGLQWPVLAAAMTMTVLAALPFPRRRLKGRRNRALLALVLGLVLVMGVRTSVEMSLLCLLAAGGLAGLLVTDARTWRGVILTPCVISLNGLRSLPWAGRGLRGVKMPAQGGSLARGIIVAGILTWACVSLLASADSAFAGLVRLLPTDLPPERIVGRCVIGGLVGGLTLALAFTAAAPPRWRQLRPGRGSRPPMEWMPPLIAVDGVLAVFLAVQAVVLFGAYPEELISGDATPAERAREGFGQLVVLTLIVAALLAWATRVAAGTGRDRRLLAVGGGVLGAEVLVVVASALRRLELYQEHFGWTVLRLDVVVFEVWLACVIIGTGVAWATRRTAVLGRAVPVAAGVVLLLLGLAGPDAVVASWNVDRYQRSGKIDTSYLRGLSDDAVPALSRLPEPLRTCVLAGREASAPWYAVNVSRVRARQVLESLGGPFPPDRDDRCPSGRLS
jgi:two-component system sensor histidine kinase BaeS